MLKGLRKRPKDVPVFPIQALHTHTHTHIHTHTHARKHATDAQNCTRTHVHTHKTHTQEPLGEGAAPKGESLSGGIAVGEGDEQVLLYFGIIDILQVCIWMSVCMCERARARVYMCVCVCACVQQGHSTAARCILIMCTWST